MGFIYTDEQQYVIDEAYKWYNYRPSEQLFQFDGLAGTGKSVVLNAIVERLGLQPFEIAPMSYIGQAAIVMRMKGLMNAKTIHSWLLRPVQDYKLDKNYNIVMNNYLNRPETSLLFESKPLEGIKLIIIDEAGTTPDSLKYEIESRGIKILACGDLGQLPPIYGKPAYLVEGKVHHLTQPMRQSLNSGIYYLAMRARYGLPIHEGFYGDALVINEDDLTDKMILQSDIIICGRNSTRDYFNKRIRNDILKIQSDLPVFGDRMVCRKNNWNIEVDGINLANGLIGTVINNPGVESFDGKNYKIDFRPNLLNSYFQGVSCDYNYLIAPYEKKKFLKNNKYNYGEKFEFAYAITCHLSQGGQFNNGIYLEEFLNKDIQNNMNYTGITRFKKSMIYVKKKRKYFNFNNV